MFRSQFILYCILNTILLKKVSSEKDSSNEPQLTEQELFQKEPFLMLNFLQYKFLTDDGLNIIRTGPVGWSDATIWSNHYYTSGIHKFSVSWAQSIIAAPSLMIGVFGQNFNKGTYVGSDNQSFSFHCAAGCKQVRGEKVSFGQATNLKRSDTVHLILDLTTTYGTVEYLINEKSMGIAFYGVKTIGKLWFGISSWATNEQFKVSYELIQK